MKLKQLLLHGAAGALLATGAVAATAAPAHAQGLTCTELDNLYKSRIENYTMHYGRFLNFAFAGRVVQADFELSVANGWYNSANSIVRC
jgi:hypothetical protein